MNNCKKERLILYSSLAFILALGLTSKLVKVKTKEMITKFDCVKPKKTIEKIGDKTKYSFELPEDYILKINENGEFIGYKEYSEEKEITLTLDRYIIKKIAK